MQPNAPAPNGNGKDQYDFIINTGTPPPVSTSKLPTQSSTKGRAIIAGVAGLLLILIGGATFSLIASSGPDLSKNLTDITYKQAEIIRLATLGTQKARNSSTQNFSYTTKLSVLSDQTATISYFKTKGGDVKADDLATRKDAQNDTALAKAEQAGAFDDTLLKILKQELAEYQKELTDTFEIVPDTKGKKVMSDSFNHAAALSKIN